MPIAHVSIINNVSSVLPLTTHCKSKNDDLGVHILNYNDSFGFGFAPNIWMTTLFFCSFGWGTTAELHWLDIYSAHKDKCECATCVSGVSFLVGLAFSTTPPGNLIFAISGIVL